MQLVVVNRAKYGLVNCALVIAISIVAELAPVVIWYHTVEFGKS